MTDAETIAELRLRLAERDAEISRMRAVIVADDRIREMLRDEKLRLGLADDLPPREKRAQVVLGFGPFMAAIRRRDADKATI